MAWARARMHGHVVMAKDINFPQDWTALTIFCEIVWGSERRGGKGQSEGESVLREGAGEGGGGKYEPDGRGGNLEDEGKAYEDDEARSRLQSSLEERAGGDSFAILDNFAILGKDEQGMGLGAALRLRVMCRYAACNLSRVGSKPDYWPR